MKQPLTNDELMDRYVHSVTMGLPPDKRADIAAEIRSNLQSLAEDRAEQLGRDVTPEEMSAILKQHGHPMTVAGRYRDQPARATIGAELSPLYWFIVRSAFGIWVTVRVIIAVFQFQGTMGAGSILLRLGRDTLVAGLIIAGGIALLFPLWEQLELRFRFSEKWKPESLPAVPAPARQWQPRPMVRIAGHVVWLIFWAMALFLPEIWWIWGGRGVFGVSDAVYAMRLPMWLLVAGGFAQSWLNYTRFAYAEWRVLLRVALYIAGTALAVYVLHAGDLLVEGPKWVATQAKSLATLNRMIGGVLMLACIFAVLLCVQELRRYVRKGGKRLGGNGQMADSTF